MPRSSTRSELLAVSNEPTNDDSGTPGSDESQGNENANADSIDHLDFAAEAPTDIEVPMEDPGEPEDPAVVIAQRDEYLDSLRRLQADFDNYRRRVKADTEIEVGRSTEKVIARVLPVLDTFDLAFAHGGGADGNENLAKIHDQLLTALEAEGLERLWPAGEAFDPNEAEAVVHEPGDGGEPVVSEVLRAGYRWKGRVMRAAMVKVKD
jgi:molecular chaperone GrpE